LIADIESLVIYAGVHTKRYGFYRMFSKHFPYAIYFELKDDIAFVAAIFPMRRDPDWAKKLGKKKLTGHFCVGIHPAIYLLFNSPFERR